MSIRDRLHDLLIEKGKTLSLAESLTGGSIAYSFVSNSGASAYFQGSIVAYSKRAKQEILGVKEQTIQTYGEVSIETAKEMAEGALFLFHTDYSISVTGIAGPTGATALKPVGLVAFGLSQKGQSTRCFTQTFQGNRSQIIEQTITLALLSLKEVLE